MIQNLPKLFFNHADAWGLTLMICIAVLMFHQQIDLESLSLVAAITTGYWFGFAVNDYFDAEIDQKTPEKAKRNFFASVQHGQFVFIGMVVLAVIFLGAVLMHYQLKGLIAFVVGLFVIWAYSAPPLRLKVRPGLDLLTHILFVETYPCFLILWLLGLNWALLDYMFVSVLALSSFAAQIEQQLRDYEVDREDGTTFVFIMGPGLSTLLLRTASAVLIFMTIAAFALDLVPMQWIPFAVIISPFLIHRFVRGVAEVRSETLVRLTTVAGLSYALILIMVEIVHL